MRYSYSSWLFGGVLAVCAMASTRADAACVPGPVELLWSYPAEGDSDIPTDAQLQIVLSAVLYGSDWDATLNGVPLQRSADGQYPLGPLAADTAYTFELEGHQPRFTDTLKVVELHFRTGSAPADAVQAPIVVSTPSAEQSDDAAMCERVDARYYCRDTPPFDVREIVLDESSAVAWIDDAGNLWPRGCFPRVDLISAQERCYKVHALSAAGDVSDPTEFCPAAATMASDPPASASCAVAAVGGSSLSFPGSVLLAVVVFRSRQRRRHAASR